MIEHNNLEWLSVVWIPMCLITIMYSATLYSLFPTVDNSIKIKSCIVPFINNSMGVTFALINLYYYYNNNEGKYFEENDMIDFLFLVFIFQGIYWDIIFGLSYYQNDLDLRIFEIGIHLIAIVLSCCYQRYRLLSIFWLTFIPDLIKNIIYIFFYNYRKTLESFYSINFISYKLTLPIVLLYNLSEKKETLMSDMISIFILSCYTFYQFSHFVLWNLETLNLNSMKKVVEKND